MSIKNKVLYIKSVYENLSDEDHQKCINILLKYIPKEKFNLVEEKNQAIYIKDIPDEAIISLYNFIITILNK